MADNSTLKNIYRDTKSKCTNGKFSNLKTLPSSKYFFDDVRYKNINFIPLYSNTDVIVVNSDTLNSCIDAINADNKANVVALNMASHTYPGGGVEHGARAQEEEVFRRTNYFLTLKVHFYPIQYGDAIYSPSVSIVKDINYNDLDINQIYNIAFIAQAAIRSPIVTIDNVAKQYKYNFRDREYMRKAIENIFKIAYANKHDTLILGALGCGAYANPPMEVITIFNEFIAKYDRMFKKIVFAVYSKNDSNYALFDKYILRVKI